MLSHPVLYKQSVIPKRYFFYPSKIIFNYFSCYFTTIPLIPFGHCPFLRNTSPSRGKTGWEETKSSSPKRNGERIPGQLLLKSWRTPQSPLPTPFAQDPGSHGNAGVGEKTGGKKGERKGKKQGGEGGEKKREGKRRGGKRREKRGKRGGHGGNKGERGERKKASGASPPWPPHSRLPARSRFVPGPFPAAAPAQPRARPEALTSHDPGGGAPEVTSGSAPGVARQRGLPPFLALAFPNPGVFPWEIRANEGGTGWAALTALLKDELVIYSGGTALCL